MVINQSKIQFMHRKVAQLEDRGHLRLARANEMGMGMGVLALAPAPAQEENGREAGPICPPAGPGDRRARTA